MERLPYVYQVVIPFICIMFPREIASSMRQVRSQCPLSTNNDTIAICYILLASLSLTDGIILIM